MKKYNKPQGCLRSKNFTTEITEKEEENKLKLRVLRGYIFLILIFVLFGCASWGAVSAEEYFAIGMAYYDMGKYAEAEKWLIRAKAKDRTMVASEYNLGRIAFETERYDDAVKHFESILKRDPNNILALKAAAYTRIRSGDIEKAAEFYDRVLVLVPESADDGYNYALVLYAMKKYDEAEKVLKAHEFALLDNNDVLLLYARAQKEQGKPEAIDTYDKWLANNTDAKVRYEYAQVLESHTMYARAMEEYRAAHTALSGGAVDPSKQDIRFSIAALLLVADSGSAEGITELKGAVDEGFSDKEKLQKLLENESISAKNKEEIRKIISDLAVQAAAQAAAEKTENVPVAESESVEGGETN
ncbi:MAG: tetratricopeptide repeat protein [Treponema sp.]|jgi:tetratricopeptide (TPR) repeat protein|nr:tetratricopeptide repeat protein [Treponema sp.]